MKITKDFFEKHLKKHNTLTVYSQENIPLTISKEHSVSPNWTASSNGCTRITSMARYPMSVLSR